MTPTLLLRYPTQDFICVREILMQNEYHLPDKFSDEDTIVDVGANIGTFAFACLTRGCGNVTCYEPEATNFELLRQNMSQWKAKADIYPLAVWRELGTVKLKKGHDQHTAMHQTLGYDAEGDVDVRAVTLDDVLKPLDKVRLLKLDCEGAEKPILDAVKSLDKVQEIIGEIHYRCPENGHEAPTDNWLRARLQQLGFKALLLGKPDPTGSVCLFWAWRKREYINGALADHQR